MVVRSPGAEQAADQALPSEAIRERVPDLRGPADSNGDSAAHHEEANDDYCHAKHAPWRDVDFAASRPFERQRQNLRDY